MFGFLFFLLSGTAVTFLLRLYLKRFYRFWETLKVPQTTPRFPLGELQNGGWKKNLSVLYDEIYKKFAKERFYGIWLFWSPVLIVKDPELIKTILVKDFNFFRDRSIYHNEKDDPLSAHMFAMDGEKWKNTRMKLSPTFSPDAMQKMFPLIMECAAELKDYLMDYLTQPDRLEEPIEIGEILAKFTTNVISLCAFGIKTNCLKNPKTKLREMAKKATEPKKRNILIFLLQTCFPKFLKFLRARVVYKDVEHYFLKMVGYVTEHREKSDKTGNDFLQLLIKLKNESSLEDTENSNEEATEVGERITFDETAAEAFAFFLAGSETSLAILQYALYEIAKSRDIQVYLRGSIINSFDDNAGEFTYESVQNIYYLNQIVEETLRKYPIVPTLVRQCVENYKIPESDVTIPKNTLVHIPVYSLHRDKKYFRDPEKFDPERFSEQRKKKMCPYTYLPFGEGPRNCIGKTFGVMPVKLALIFLLGNFEFELCEEVNEPLTFSPKSFLLVPDTPLKLKVNILWEWLF